MKSVVRCFCVLAAFIGAATAHSVWAADQGLPIYPNGVSKNPEIPPGGPLYQKETTDSASQVDAWYLTRLPKSCAHETAKGGAKYTCSNTNIMITPDHGKTLITYMPKMFGR